MLLVLVYLQVWLHVRVIIIILASFKIIVVYFNLECLWVNFWRFIHVFLRITFWHRMSLSTNRTALVSGVFTFVSKLIFFLDLLIFFFDNIKVFTYTVDFFKVVHNIAFTHNSLINFLFYFLFFVFLGARLSSMIGRLNFWLSGFVSSLGMSHHCWHHQCCCHFILI